MLGLISNRPKMGKYSWIKYWKKIALGVNKKAASNAISLIRRIELRTRTPSDGARFNKSKGLSFGRERDHM
jgi:hypothetical protein